MESILIQGGLIITVDSDNQIIEKGYVAINGNKIVGVGDLRKVGPQSGFDRIIDASGKIIMPGLVCNHSHMHGLLATGMPRKKTLVLNTWIDRISKRWWPMVEDQLTKKDIYASSLASCVEMIKNGTTCVCNVLEGPNALPGALDPCEKATRETGMRGVLCFEATERVSKENGELGIKENMRLIEKHEKSKGDSIRGRLCIHTTFTCSSEILMKVRELADKTGTGITLHLSEDEYHVDQSVEKFGKRPVIYLKDLGFLGPDVLAAQCVCLNNEEIEILSKKRVCIAHNPLSNLELGVGIAPVVELAAMGAVVGLGNDGYLPAYDLFESMRTAYLVHKVRLHDFNILPAVDVLKMATIDSARSLGLQQEVGSIEVGKKADVIIVDAKSPTIVDSRSAVSHIVNSGRGSNVETVIIDGKTVMHEREIKTVDENEAFRKCRNAALELWKRNNLVD